MENLTTLSILWTAIFLIAGVLLLRIARRN